MAIPAEGISVGFYLKIMKPHQRNQLWRRVYELAEYWSSKALGASAVSLLATIMAWGREGIAHFIDLAMSNSEKFAIEIQKNERINLWAFPQTGVTVFRPVDLSTRDFMANLPSGMFSSCKFWSRNLVRSVAANPMTDIEQVLRIVKKVLSQG